MPYLCRASVGACAGPRWYDPLVSAPPDAPAAAKPAKGPRYLVLLGLTVVMGIGLGLAGAVAVAALASFLPSIVGVLLGAVLAFGLPVFLAVRASLALKRRGRGTLLRRLVVLFLVGATQLAILGAVLEFSDRGTGHLAAAGAGALHSVGGVPVLSGLLEEHARRAHVPLPYTNAAAVGPDSGPVGADGGTLDGGVTEARDAGPAAPAPALSPRTPSGAPVRTVAFAATLRSGAPVLVVVQLAFGGTITPRVVDLSAHAKHGAITAVAAAEDGSAVAVLGGTHVVLARAGRSAELFKAVSRGAKLSLKEGKATFTYEIQAARDVAIGPGGDVILVADALDPVDTTRGLTPLLLAVSPGGAPQLVRRGGEPVPEAPEQSVALGFNVKPGRGDGRVVVSETFRDGPDAIAPGMTGEQYQLNPQRLLLMRADQPKVLQEVARTDDAATGIDQRTVQAFADAAALPDGRVVFDANFVEEGPSGWLFSWRSGAAFVQALAPELVASRAAVFSARAPRARLLDVEADGAFVFLAGDALVLSRLQAPREGERGLRGAPVVARTDAGATLRGTVSRIDVPFVANGGGWVLALGAVDGVGDALLLASPADLKKGVFELVLGAGQSVPGAAGAVAELATLRLPVEDELLWTPAPAASAPVASPAAPAVAPKPLPPPDAGTP